MHRLNGTRKCQRSKCYKGKEERKTVTLELLRKGLSIFKLFKLIAVKHAMRAFTEDTQGLFTSARVTSFNKSLG